MKRHVVFGILAIGILVVAGHHLSAVVSGQVTVEASESTVHEANHAPAASLAETLSPAETTALAALVPLQDVKQVAAGGWHTCALTTGGGVLCWGRNESGQLGDGTTTNRYLPGWVSGLGSGVSAIGAGYDYTCAVTTSGGVLCWGHNADGELGDGTTTMRLTPVAVSGLGSGVALIRPGWRFTCAVTTGGGAKCWGRNENGELGDGTTTKRTTPTNVYGLGSGVENIAPGGDHTCARTTAGQAFCWGDNSYGQLGDGTTTDRLTPVTVSGLGNGVSLISAGQRHTCAQKSGAAYCWGRNQYGQLGDGTTTNRSIPTLVHGLGSNQLGLTASWYDTCALTATRAVMCWGYNWQGELGDGTKDMRTTPVAVSGLSNDIVHVRMGESHTCALTLGGELRCWGTNYYGQLGDNTQTSRYTPVSVLTTCYALFREHNGSGNDPVAAPDRSMTCSTGFYLAGATITLTAAPASGWQVASWSGTNNNASTATTNSLTMPANSHTATVNYAAIPPTCYTLTRTHTGGGSDPLASPTSSTGCATGQYVAGAAITLTAAPASGWQVISWSGTNNNASTDTTNSLTMPANSHTATVNYAAIPPTCYTLTRTHTGSGSDPLASPTNSTGCATGQYVAGATITLTAAPASGWQVASWSGTNNNASTDTTNSLTMPANSHTVTVNYAAIPPTCYTLTRTHTGSGSDPLASPTNSAGCATGQYVAGATIALTAAPASGWQVVSWSGTNNNASTATTNSLTVPGWVATVAVNYARRSGLRVYLPLITKPQPAPAEPQLNNITPPEANTSYAISWNNVTNATSYHLERATRSDFSDTEQVYTGANPVFTAPSAGITMYYYRVQALGAGGTSGWSNTRTVSVRWELEPNNEGLDALRTGALQPGSVYYGILTGAEPASVFGTRNDYFYLDLNTTGRIELWLTNMATGQDLNLMLRDSQLNPVLKGFSGSLGNTDEHILTDPLAPGRYYVQINWTTGNNMQPYHLRGAW